MTMTDHYLANLLGEKEKIILVTHRHWFVLVEQILVEIILSILTVVIVTILLLVSPQGPLVAAGYLVLIIPLVSLFRDYLIWSNHKYVVTSQRVIQVMGIFNKNVIDSSLEKVNDVKMVQSALGRLFNFGDLEILTASELGVNRFTRIGDPVHFKTAMLNAKMKLEEVDVVVQQAPSTLQDIPALIARLGDLRERGLLTEAEFQAKKAKLLAQL
jgi:uncharacterized membrane protein YdbT with pleckstrin-like domain